MKGLKQLLDCPLDDLKAWLTYIVPDDGSATFDLYLSCAHAEEQSAFIRKFGKRTPTDEQWRDYWLSHVLDWRGCDDVPYSPEMALVLWSRDASFRSWLIQESQRLHNFRARD